MVKLVELAEQENICPVVKSFFLCLCFLYWVCSFAISHLALKTSASGEGYSRDIGRRV